VLRANGYVVTDVATGEAALDAVATEPFDVMILDLGLPDLDGVEVCRRLREWSRLPVIVLSVEAEEETKIRALNEGADDYVTKPFSAPELIARIGSTLRRASWETAPDEPVIYAGEGAVAIDLSRRVVSRHGQEVHLTPMEFDVLSFLARHAGRVITHVNILRSVLGPGYEEANGTLRVHVASLRKKLEADPSHPQIILTEPGIGYRLRAEVGAGRP
jgi:two-component system KDP operon response regulator KdpE